MLGDRWSLLIIRDMKLHGARTYKTFLECYEGIATNILADRLHGLVEYGIIKRRRILGRTQSALPDDEEGNRSGAGADRNGALGGCTRRHRQPRTRTAHAGGQGEVHRWSARAMGKPPLKPQLGSNRSSGNMVECRIGSPNQPNPISLALST